MKVQCEIQTFSSSEECDGSIAASKIVDNRGKYEDFVKFQMKSFNTIFFIFEQFVIKSEKLLLLIGRTVDCLTHEFPYF